MPKASRNQYDLTTRWQFEAPLDAVWAAIIDAEAWPRWWKGVESVVTLESGDARGLGARRRFTCKSVLPYRLVFVTRVTRLEPLRLIEGRVEGELEGLGTCHFAHHAGLTRLRYEWRVRTTGRWMNLLAPLAMPLFRWNHDKIMDAGGTGLGRYLDEQSR